MSNTIINEVSNKAAFLKLVDLQVYAAEWEWYDDYVEELFEVAALNLIKAGQEVELEREVKVKAEQEVELEQ